ALLTLGACSAGGSGGAAFAGPDEMAAKAKGAVSLNECGAPSRDAFGTMYVQCVDETEGLVRFSTFDEGDSNAETLSQTGWKVHDGGTWSVAVNSDQATLDKIVGALS